MDEFSNERDPIMDMFIFETNQLLEQLEDIMLTVEQEGDISAENINEIFRAMHTIKGSAAMMSFDNISTVAHKIEDLFFKVRDNNTAGDQFSKICDVVFEGTDYLKAQMEKVANCEDVNEVADDLIAKIAGILAEMNGETSETTPPNKAELVDKGDNIKDKLLEETSDDISNDLTVKIYFEKDCKMENVRAFSLINEVSKYCKSVTSTPSELFEDPTSSEFIAKNGLLLNITTELSAKKIKRICEKQICVDKVEVVEAENEVKPVSENISNQKISNDVKKADVPSSKVVAPKQTVAAKQSLINVNVDKLDALLDYVGEIVITQSMVVQNPDLKGYDIPNFRKNAEQLQKLTKELQDVVMAIRMVPIASVFHKMNRIVRDMSKSLNKEVDLAIIGEETEIDKTIIDNLSDPLMHLVRNCMDHGLETSEERLAVGKPEHGKVTLRAYNDGNSVVVTVSDDGKGLNKEKILQKAIENGLLPADTEDIPDQKIYECVLLPGFSTKDKVTEFSGRGVGMDVVKQNIESIGGSISLNSKPGEGTMFMIKIPLTLAIINGMSIAVGNVVFVLPILSIKETFRCKKEEISEDPYGKEMVLVRGKYYDVIRLHNLYSMDNHAEDIEDGVFIMVERDNKLICLFVDKIIGEQQVVIKPLPRFLQKILPTGSGISGCTILGDGNIGFILNTNEM